MITTFRIQLILLRIRRYFNTWRLYVNYVLPKLTILVKIAILFLV